MDGFEFVGSSKRIRPNSADDSEVPDKKWASGGLLTSRASKDESFPLQKRCSSNRTRAVQGFEDIPRFPGCPEWTKPMLYSEYQVFFIVNITNLKPWGSFLCDLIMLNSQVGYSEAWLCSIFSNLSDDLSHALQEAWFATMLMEWMHRKVAENNLHNLTRHAVAPVLGFIHQVALPQY
jgi:hypothetical protein